MNFLRSKYFGVLTSFIISDVNSDSSGYFSIFNSLKRIFISILVFYYYEIKANA